MLGIGAAPAVAGMSGGGVGVLGYGRVQGLSVFTFCWIWQLKLELVDVSDTHLHVGEEAPGGFKFLLSLKCVHAHFRSKAILSSEYFPRMRGVLMLQESFLVKF